MELWSMAAKGFPAIFRTENGDSASFSYELLYKRNVSSNDNDEHLQVTRTIPIAYFIVIDCLNS